MISLTNLPGSLNGKKIHPVSLPIQAGLSQFMSSYLLLKSHFLTHTFACSIIPYSKLPIKARYARYNAFN